MAALKKPVPFGKYYLLERINVGGMAEVFKAKTFGVEGFERLLAVKRILPNIAEDEEFITMFIDEAKIAVQLQHANIAQIFDLGKVDDSFFIALEYVHGRDLRSIFDRMRNKAESLPISMACYVTMQVCEGLDYAHNKRDAQGRELFLVHRDISPQNVLIGYEGEVKLIDFGIAKAAGKASKTQAGILKGKFGYMSPEQVRGLPIDKRSDIFAVGIVLYELLTGERLFIGESDFSTLEKVRNVEIQPPSSYNKKIPQELERVVLKALARDPDDRYANAIDLHDDLQSFLYSVGEFFSRKDLAAWMKKTFAMEIEEDNAKLEEYRQIAAPVAASGAEVSRRAAVAGVSQGRPGAGGTNAKAPAKAPPPKGNPPPASVHQAMGWDDEELDTQIFDKEEVKPVAAEDLFFEDDDRTVANEPAPDILEQARPPELMTPKPVVLTPLPSEDIKMTPPPMARPLPPPPGARRPTLVGVAPAGVPTRPTRPSGPVPTLPPPGPPAGRAGIRRSSMNMQPASAHTAAPPPSQPRMPTPMQQPMAHPPAVKQRFHVPQEAPFGTGGFETIQARRPARRGVYGLLAVAAVAIVAMVYWYNSNIKPGRIELTVTPGDATVLIDNIKVGDHSPVSVEKSPGPYTLSVTRDGYARNDQNIELKAGQPLALTVTLEPSPDTGFELTSDPPGGLVWLDDQPVKDASGQQAHTNFRASRISPGHHVLEIRGDKFKAWRQDVEIAPGDIRKIHAPLIPSVGGPAGSKSPVAIGTAPPGGAKEQLVAAATAPPGGTPPTTTPPAVKPPAGGPANPANANPSGTGTAPAGGGIASAPTTPRRKRVREAPPSDDTGGEAGSDDAPAPRRTVAAADDSGGGGDCSITINSIPWSEVWIDGKNTSKHTPVVDFKVPCGKHKLAFKRPDMQIDQTESINVRPGQNFKQRYTLATED